MGVPGTDILVTSGYDRVYRHQTGFCDYEKRERTNENNLYRLFSATYDGGTELRHHVG